MSIAASVMIKPSRLLLALVAAVCSGAALIGLLVGLGGVGELTAWQRGLLAAPCILLALAGFARTARAQRTYRLDFSGTGQIRLHVVGAAGAEGLLVTLLAGSTLWPRFLLLRLRAEDGKVYVVPILHDSLPAESLRAVAVACRWIAAHNLHL